MLQKDDEVNIPDPDFVPILAARFAAEAVVADGLSPETRTRMLQRLVRMALPNPTAVDTVLGRLILSTLDRPAETAADAQGSQAARMGNVRLTGGLARLRLRPASMEEWVRLASHSVSLPRFAGRAVLTGENLTRYHDFWAVKTARGVSACCE